MCPAGLAGRLDVWSNMAMRQSVGRWLERAVGADRANRVRRLERRARAGVTRRIGLGVRPVPPPQPRRWDSEDARRRDPTFQGRPPATGHRQSGTKAGRPSPLATALLGRTLADRDLRNIAVIAFGAKDLDLLTAMDSLAGQGPPTRAMITAVGRQMRRPVSHRGGRRQEQATVTGQMSSGQRRITVLAPAGNPDWHLPRYGAKRVSVKNLVEVNWQLKRLGPFDAIIDLSDGEILPHDDTWSMIFLHLRDGGVYISIERGTNALTAVLADIVRGTGPRWARDAAATISFAGPFISVEKKGEHLLKLRHHEVDRFLPSRDVPATATLLAKLPPGEVASTTVLTLHESATPMGGFPATMSFPEMRMRLYSGRLAMATHGLLYTEGTFLPETYRHHLEKRLKHTRVNDSTGQFGTLADDHRPERFLPGVYFDLNPPFPGHFGHFTTEVLSRLWGWDDAKRRFPDLKAVGRLRFPNERDPDFERQFLRAYGIDEADLVWIDEPVWLENVIGVTPMWHNQFPHYVHPDMANVWTRIGDRLAVQPTGASPRIFVSRRSGLERSCRNAATVEEIFRRYGFAVVYPEELSLAEQAGTFRAATTVAGFGGSGMFNVMFCDRLQHLIVLTHEGYTARNEYMFASLLGGRTDYFWSTPELAHPPGGWSEEAFRSPWSFDLERNLADLEKLLASLA